LDARDNDRASLNFCYEKGRFFFKKSLKLLLWIFLGILGLIFSAILLLQIPAIQNKIAQKGASWLSSKTHTKVSVKSISLSLTGNIICEEIYIEDLKKDTLLYSARTSVNLSLLPLITKEINIRSVNISSAVIHLNTDAYSGEFNYQFIVDAFSDSTKLKDDTDTSSAKWEIDLHSVRLESIHFKYADNFGGTYLSSSLKDMYLSMDKIDLEKMNFEIDRFYADGAAAALIQKSGKTKITEKKIKSRLPQFSAKKIILKNSSFTLADSVTTMNIRSYVGNVKLQKLNIDLNTQKIGVSKTSVENSTAIYIKTKQAEAGTITDSDTSITSPGWEVRSSEVQLKNNFVSYHNGNEKQLTRSFDANHIEYSELSLSAKDLLYSREKTTIAIQSMSATDKKGLSLKHLETSFVMDEHSITVTDLKAITAASSLDLSSTISYQSLSTLKDSLHALNINLHLNNSKVKTSDILYFSPELVKQPFFRHANNVSTISGNINGRLSNLKAENIIISTAGKTTIRTTAIVAGLPYADAVFISCPEINLHSGRQDIEMVIGPALIPKEISLPSDIQLQASFHGKMKAFETKAFLQSEYGKADLKAELDQQEKFTVFADIDHFDLGALLKNKKMFGPVTLHASAAGQGLSKKTVRAKVNVDAPEFYLNQYVYHKLNIDGNINAQQFEGRIQLNDLNAAFDFDGLVNADPENAKYKFRFDLKGADLKQLHFTEKDLRIGMLAVADLEGSNMHNINGKAGITKIIIGHEGKKYLLDSLLFASINENQRSELNITSALIGVKYNGTFAPIDLVKELKSHINNYFLLDSIKPGPGPRDQRFSFELELKNHPLISEVFFPSLKSFDPGLITGKFDSNDRKLELNATIRDLVYGSIDLKNFDLAVSSDATALSYRISTMQIANNQIKLENLLIDGKLQDQKMTTDLSITDADKTNRLSLQSQITRLENEYRLHFSPDRFFMGTKQWTLPENNYIAIGSKGFMIHEFQLKSGDAEVSAESVNHKYKDDLALTIANLELLDLSKIVKKDTSLASGKVNGNVLFKRVNNSYGITADASIKSLFIREIPVGDISLKASNPTTERFDIELALIGNENDVNVSGFFMPKEEKDAMNFSVKINSLSMKTAEAFSFGQITEGAGSMSADLKIAGNTKEPEVTGTISFHNAYAKPAISNIRLQLKNETLTLHKDGIRFRNFTILDEENKSAIINGDVTMRHFKDIGFALTVNTNDFTLINTTAKDNEVYYGRMIIDSKIKVSGTLELPVVNANIRMKEGSNFTFAVPEKKLSTDRGEDVVIFIDSSTFHPIIVRNEKKEAQKSSFKGMDISSTIQVDKKATLRLLMDPSATDSLVVRGDAALSFSLDRSGKTSITGAYNLDDGSYLVSLEAIVKRQFKIEPGSTIVWNGDPLDADVNISAIYSIRASPIDLVADQVAGLTEADKNGFKQRYPFLVYLKLKGNLMKPDISFEIQLPPEERGILGGAVNAKLNMLNEDPSALNKQVFALLVLGRFVQEDPLQTETNAVASAARTTVGKFLSAQLNQLSQKVVPGVELSFDVQSYDDYSTGEAEGRTEVEVGLKKQLFNERLEVQVGGTVDVEGERAKQNNASDITSDVTLEYKLTKDGRYRLKGFRHNQYQGALDGQLVETGGGILYIRDFDKWKEFFQAPKNKTKDQEQFYSNDSIKK
jgi:hypothetical protein